MDVDLFFGLDDDLINDILSSWLDVKDVALGLDCALINRSLREKYLLHLYNSIVTLNTRIRIEAQVPSSYSSLRPDVSVKRPRRRQSELDTDACALSWLFHHNFAVTALEFRRNIQQSDLAFIDQRMIDRLESLSMTLHMLSDLDVYCIATCRKLTSLRLDCWIGVSPSREQFRTICINCTQLKSLELMFCQSLTVDDAELIQQSLPQLTQLVLQDCGGIKFRNVQHLLAVLGHIDSLHISSIVFTDPIDMPASTTATLGVKTKRLSLPLTPLVSCLTHCPLVTHVRSVIRSSDTHTALMALANSMSNGRVVSLLQQSASVPFDAIVSESNRSRDSLQELSLESWENGITANVVKSIVENFPVLERLVLSGKSNDPWTGDDGQEPVDVDGGGDDDDDTQWSDEDEPEERTDARNGLDRGAIEDNAMAEEGMREADSENESCVFRLVNKARPWAVPLHSLSLSGVTLSADGLQYLSRTVCASLTSLQIARCCGVTVTALLSVADACSRLTSLDLSCLNAVNDDVLKRFLQNNANLQELHVRKCSRVSAVLILLLHESPNRVHSLSIAHTMCELRAPLHVFELSFQQGLHSCLMLKTLALSSTAAGKQLRKRIHSLARAAGFRESPIHIEHSAYATPG